jgi:hypothetical protein
MFDRLPVASYQQSHTVLAVVSCRIFGFQNRSHGLLMLPTAILHGKVEFDFHAFSGKHTSPQDGLKLSGANVNTCSEFQGLLSGKTCVDDTWRLWLTLTVQLW